MRRGPASCPRPRPRPRPGPPARHHSSGSPANPAASTALLDTAAVGGRLTAGQGGMAGQRCDPCPCSHRETARPAAAMAATPHAERAGVVIIGAGLAGLAVACALPNAALQARVGVGPRQSWRGARAARHCSPGPVLCRASDATQRPLAPGCSRCRHPRRLAAGLGGRPHTCGRVPRARTAEHAARQTRARAGGVRRVQGQTRGLQCSEGGGAEGERRRGAGGGGGWAKGIAARCPHPRQSWPSLLTPPHFRTWSVPTANTNPSPAWIWWSTTPPARRGGP